MSPRRSLDTRIPWCVSLSRSMSLTVSCAHGARTRSSAHSALVRARDTRQVTHPLVEVIHPLVAGSWREATLLNHHSSRPRRGRRSGGGRARRGRRMRLSGAEGFARREERARADRELQASAKDGDASKDGDGSKVGDGRHDMTPQHSLPTQSPVLPHR